MLVAFNVSHTQNTKGHSGSEKTHSIFTQNCYFPNAPICITAFCNDCIICQLNKKNPNQKQIAQKQEFKDKVYISTIVFQLTQKYRFYHPLKETPILWSLLMHSSTQPSTTLQCLLCIHNTLRTLDS